MQGSRFRSFLFHLARFYWKVFRPKTFGVKGIVPHPDDERQVLLIRNTYGNTMLWNLPGGGYHPKRESPVRAIEREIREELSVTPDSTEQLGEYQTDAEGKRDTVTIFLCRITSDHARGNSEIAEVKWVSLDKIDSLQQIARAVFRGMEFYAATSKSKISISPFSALVYRALQSDIYANRVCFLTACIRYGVEIPSPHQPSPALRHPSKGPPTAAEGQGSCGRLGFCDSPSSGE